MSSPSAERAPLRGLLLLAALAAAVFVAALLIGSSGISVSRALAALVGAGDETTRSVLIAVRLPRVMAAFGVGSLLALSGGAAVGALLAMIAGAAAIVVQSAAVAGALGAVGTVYLLSRGGGTPRLLLTGVVLASACGALVIVLLALADSSRVRGMVFWLAGDLEWAVSPALSAGAAALAVTVAIAVARPLNVLAAGELRARTVGLALEAWRTLLFIACAILTAIAVVSAGTVGFVGLITPHAVRLQSRSSDHRVVAPGAALAGGTVLAAADLVARTCAAPRQLPVGAIMALVGAPLFVVLLRGRGR